MSVHKRPDSKKSPWRVSYRDATGAQRSKSFATHKEAVAFDASIKTTAPKDRAPATAVPTMLATIERPAGMLLRDWIAEWFANYGPAWAVKTRKQRAAMVARWIVPLIGDIPVEQVSKRLVKTYRAEMLARGATNNTVNSAVSVLSACLTAAEEDDVIDANPCLRIRKLPHHRKAIRPLTPLEVEAIRYAMPTPRDKIIVSLIAYAGLRPGEVCGLTWSHVRNGIILVDQTIQEGEVGPTKTKRTRTVRVMPCLQADLDAYGRGADTDFVAPGDKGGPLNWNNWGSRVWREVVPDEDVVPYHLRHTFASLALHEGRSLPWLAEEMGHATAGTLWDYYAHLYQESELETRVPMNEAVQAARSTPPSTAPVPAAQAAAAALGA